MANKNNNQINNVELNKRSYIRNADILFLLRKRF